MGKVKETMQIIGRNEEIAELKRYMASDRAEFIAVYGRRRVGKTFLVSTYFNNSFAFSATGILGGKFKDEIEAFGDALIDYGFVGDAPKNWREAFRDLKSLLSSKLSVGTRCVIFLDELPCFATRNSGFVKQLDHFWNDWASKHPEILLIVCGSATSWIVRNLIDNKGGLHDRITHEMHLYPFTLADTMEYLKSVGAEWDALTVVQTYMILGGIPYYLSLLNPELSLAQNIDALFFSRKAELKKEYKRLYKSLFANPEKYMDVIKTLADTRKGLTRSEIAEKMKIENNGHLSDMLEDLVNCDFIRLYNIKVKKISATGGIYCLTDFYSIFYHEFGKSRTTDTQYWTKTLESQVQSTWWGLAYERVCQAHMPQILSALGVPSVRTEYYSWRGKKDPDSKERNVQVDIIIERADRIINLCEVKYTSEDEYELTSEDKEKIQNRVSKFRKETGTKYGIVPTLLTTYGLKPGINSGIIKRTITMFDLFK